MWLNVLTEHFIQATPQMSDTASELIMLAKALNTQEVAFQLNSSIKKPLIAKKLPCLQKVILNKKHESKNQSTLPHILNLTNHKSTSIEVFLIIVKIITKESHSCDFPCKYLSFPFVTDNKTIFLLARCTMRTFVIFILEIAFVFR